MSIISRINKSGSCEITQFYSIGHKAIDVVGKNHTLDTIISHSDGVVVEVVNNINYNTYPNGKNIYGNFIKIKHDDYYTLYAHQKYNTINLKIGDKVKKGDNLGYMGNTGYSNGGHLHFEVRNINNERIDPIEYLSKDLPIKKENTNINKNNNVYIVKKGDTLTKIAKNNNTTVDELVKINSIKDRNLIFVGQTIYIKNNSNIIYLKNNNKNNSIVDALKEINIDSSYSYRKKLAIINGINNYSGTSLQNTKLLNLLKQGLLIKY